MKCKLKYRKISSFVDRGKLDTYGTKLHFLRRFSYKINYSIWLNDLHFEIFMHSKAKVSKVFRVKFLSKNLD